MLERKTTTSPLKTRALSHSFVGRDSGISNFVPVTLVALQICGAMQGAAPVFLPSIFGTQVMSESSRDEICNMA